MAAQVVGEVMVVKSGPEGINNWEGDDAEFSLEFLADSILFYRRKDPTKVFAEREAFRAWGHKPPDVATFSIAGEQGLYQHNPQPGMAPPRMF